VPVSPDLAASLAKDTLAVYVDAEEQLLALVAQRLAAGVDEPGWVDAKLAEVARLRRQAQQVVDRLTEQGGRAVADAVTVGYARGVASAGTDLTAVTSTPISIAFGATNTAAVDALVAAAQQAVGGTHLQISRAVTDAYQQVVTQAAAQVLIGAQTRRQAAQQALDRFAARGVSGFTDRAGRKWDMASYAEMATRTASGQAAVQGHVDRLVAAGQSLGIVSDAPQECRLCRPWEGKVLALVPTAVGTHTGENLRGAGTVTVRVTHTLVQARAEGLFHPGCRHSMSLYTPGLTRPLTRTADPAGDAARQRQRLLERRIRAAKRQQAVALDEPARRAATAKVRARQAALRQHVADNDLQRLPYREQIRRAR
jgi:hypothetical protein